MNTGGHWFWWALTMACVIWYSTITIYVAFKGVFDIKGMLARLEQKGIDNKNATK
ncbi:MAG: hypothetical protein HZB26_20760 [Candidatus Hydrogenedentes bacterium]|nr:hypothetical protein [Candidatus Hydrogenedentota bacterium]